jgi:hypothetical protein
VVALDRLQPEVLEQYRIVADQDAVHELDITSPLAAARRYLEVDVFYGGRLCDRGTSSRDRPGLALDLPEPLSQGEPHDFAVRFRLASPLAMRSYVVHVPGHPCELFDLRVRFGRGWTPPHVWTLRDVPQSAGLGYGARWEADENGARRRPTDAGRPSVGLR